MDCNQILVTGSGDPARDFIDLNSAIAACQDRGGGAIYVQGDFNIAKDIHFLGRWNSPQFVPVSLIGVPGGRARFLLAPGVQLLWDAMFELSRGPQWHPITSIESNTFRWADPQDRPAVLNRGDVLVFKSDDEIKGMPLHAYGYKHLSLEAHTYDDSNGDELVTDSHFEDPMVTNPMGALMPMVQGVQIKDITICSNGEYSDGYGVVLTQLQGGVIDRVRFGDDELQGPGGVYWKNNTDTVMSHCTWSENQNYEGAFGYGNVMAMCTNCRIENSLVRFTRHPMTTGNTWFNGGSKERRGTSLNCVFQNNHVIHAARKNGMTCFDTHPEGCGIVVRNNLFELLGNEQVLAINCRSRKMVVESNVFRSNGLRAKGGNVSADGCVIRNNVLDGFWYGWATTPSVGYAAKDITFAHNDYYRIGGEGLIINGGSDIHVFDELFASCGGDPRGRKPACIKVAGSKPSGLTIEGCNMSRRVGICAVWADHGPEVVSHCRGNQMYGYGAGRIGVAGSKAAAWEAEFARDNFTDTL